jgi:hypothetical protein
MEEASWHVEWVNSLWKSSLTTYKPAKMKSYLLQNCLSFVQFVDSIMNLNGTNFNFGLLSSPRLLYSGNVLCLSLFCSPTLSHQYLANPMVALVYSSGDDRCTGSCKCCYPVAFARDLHLCSHCSFIVCQKEVHLKPINSAKTNIWNIWNICESCDDQFFKYFKTRGYCLSPHPT